MPKFISVALSSVIAASVLVSHVDVAATPATPAASPPAKSASTSESTKPDAKFQGYCLDGTKMVPGIPCKDGTKASISRAGGGSKVPETSSN